MVDIQLTRTEYRRRVAKEPVVLMRNRFFEQNPVLNDSQEYPAVIARPALKKIGEYDEGHVRFTYSAPGTFDGNLFIVSGTHLWRIDSSATGTDIGALENAIGGAVSMAATGNIGETPAYLFIADGGVLWVYTENGSAVGHLQATGVIANNDVVEIGGIYYKFTNGSVDTGTPAGTSGSPWLVKLGGTAEASLASLYLAINSGGGAGDDYSTNLTANEFVASNVQTGNDLYVVAREAGSDGNAITTTETGANLSWGGATLSGGGTDQLRQVGMPDDVGAISVATFNSYVIVVPVQGRGVNGRFYWIDPGETFVDPLNFATAERSPDAINQVLAVSDRFWLLGQNSSETWVTTGNIDAPMIRMQGVLYEQGAWAGTAAVADNSIILVSQNGDVYGISGGLEVLSRPDIAEMIREAIAYQQAYGV